jgi:hypothetical protein
MNKTIVKKYSIIQKKEDVLKSLYDEILDMVRSRIICHTKEVDTINGKVFFDVYKKHLHLVVINKECCIVDMDKSVFNLAKVIKVLENNRQITLREFRQI